MTGWSWRKDGREEPFVPDGRLTGADGVARWDDGATGDRDLMVRHDGREEDSLFGYFSF